MSLVCFEQEGQEDIVVELRDPRIAALLAWLWPGAGHFYQRRFAKGFLFMICIVGTYFYGLGLGYGRVVYTSFRKNDFRWQYVCQLGVGLPSMLAIVQKLKTNNERDPLFVIAQRYPPDHPQAYQVIPRDKLAGYTGPTIKDGLMAPPRGPIDPNENDVLGMWHYELRHRYDIGTLFTVVAGLLNILAIYDAFAGPAIIDPGSRKRRRRRERNSARLAGESQEQKPQETRAPSSRSARQSNRRHSRPESSGRAAAKRKNP